MDIDKIIDFVKKKKTSSVKRAPVYGADKHTQQMLI